MVEGVVLLEIEEEITKDKAGVITGIVTSGGNSGGFNNGYGRGGFGPAGYGRGSYSSAAVVCQIFLRYNHIAAECRDRFNKNFIPNYPPQNFFLGQQQGPRAAYMATFEGVAD